MRAVVQRVTEASVTVEGRVVGEIGPGLVILLGVTHGDTEAEARYLARKIANLRIFTDAEGKLNLSARDVGGSALVVSQFTLYANCRKGRRPSFSAAARLEIADPLIERFIEFLRAEGLAVESGQFQAEMLVRIFNDGPVTIILDTQEIMPNR
ncbi:MAG TPA: D-tyrosyl-tRNA(Tyr) deacylase [Anaerolineae bacterium]|nr:D-tyrosyl-tRNA(Tyr) deacylase [Anaerolineae bacterium]